MLKKPTVATQPPTTWRLAGGGAINRRHFLLAGSTSLSTPALTRAQPAQRATAAPLATIQVDGTAIPIHGECPPAFARVLSAFGANFRDRSELGASFCVYVEGQKVVDLWAGHRDPARTTAWTGDTLVGMASVLKGMLAMALHLLAEQGKIDYDSPVVRYWPEFGQGGKERVTVRQAISHHAAIQFCDAAAPGDFFRWDRFVAAVAQQKPEWAPGTRGAYHTLTFMPIVGQLIEKASGQRPWDYFREQVTQRLGVDYHVRMQTTEVGRFAADVQSDAFVNSSGMPPSVMARLFKPLGNMANPAATLTPSEVAQLPLMTAAGTARGVARLFAFAAMDGALDGVRILSTRTLDLMTQVQWDAPCAVWGTPMRAALGLLLNNSFYPVGPNPRAFGTAGAGGSFAMADRQHRLSMGYSLNRWWPALALGDRSAALVDATYASL
jgi:CubicO group peptidase (beta-lactamase class C family)